MQNLLVSNPVLILIAILFLWLGLMKVTRWGAPRPEGKPNLSIFGRKPPKYQCWRCQQMVRGPHTCY